MASETYAPSPTNCKLGAGAIFFDRHDAALAKTGFFHLGNAKDLRASANQTRVTLPSYVDETGGIYAEGAVTQEVTISALVYEFNRKNIALLASGAEAFYTQTATTVTGETLNASLALGAHYQTAFRNIGTLVVKQGTTTLTTTSYSIVDATAGLIKILTTGSAVEGSPVTADYVGAAVATTAQPIVQLYNAPNIFGSLLFISADRQGPAWEMQWWKTSVQQGDLEGLIGDDFASSTLSFKLLTDKVGTYGGSVASPYGTAFRR